MPKNISCVRAEKDLVRMGEAKRHLEGSGTVVPNKWGYNRFSALLLVVPKEISYNKLFLACFSKTRFKFSFSYV